MAIKTRIFAWAVWISAAATGPAWAADSPPGEAPRALDPRLEVTRFAEGPEIVQPIAIDFDARGRLLVVESHTHFRPEAYRGPKADRVRVLEDTDGDGRADRFSTFFEGTRFTMDIAAHPDGSLYLATRNEVLRLRDTDGDGKADESRRVVFLDTRGDYPHNGLSGLAFDSKGDLLFGMGENLGADYALRGADDAEIRGGGEGGGVFWCSADGRGLRRVATGFWNPFGVGRDIFGRLFAVDNDPDSMPPCRLLNVVEGGDYGYQFRYGRSGRHVFQAWNGELPGTLPMVGGTGESPCEVVSYESDGLPAEYVGNLLVTTWADHRVDRYLLRERGASFVAEPQPFVRGDKDFRPVGLATAPDGSLFVSDWVLSDYNLHGKGAVWQIRSKAGAAGARPTDPRQGLASAHRPLRDASARKLAADDAGRAFLRDQLSGGEARVRAAALTALIDAGDRRVDLEAIAEKDDQVGLRVLAVRALAARGDAAARFADEPHPPAVRREAIAALKANEDLPRLLALLGDPDPFLSQAARRRLAGSPERLKAVDRRAVGDPRRRAGILLAYRDSGLPEATALVPEFLADPDEDVRFLAAKWVADAKLTKDRAAVAEALKDRGLNFRMASAYATALARIDGRDVSEAKQSEEFLARLADDRSPPSLRVLALRLVPATHPGLTIALLTRLLDQDDAPLRLEAVRALCEHPDRRRFEGLLGVARDSRQAVNVRAQAILGLAERSRELRDELLRMAESEETALREEALRALIATPLEDPQRERLGRLAQRHPGSAPLVARVLGQPFATDRPSTDRAEAWLGRLEGPADADAGRRVFFHAKLAGCFRCHRAEGRGHDVGPDLSTIGRTDRRRILESILRPGDEIGPSFQAWQIETADGRLATGMLVRTALDESTYVDTKGDWFTLHATDVADRRGLSTSIMPTGLPDLLTDQELRDLLAYLSSRQ